MVFMLGILLVHSDKLQCSQTLIPPASDVSNLDDELFSTGVLLCCQVLSTCLEVIKDILLVAVSASVMPLQAILPPTPAGAHPLIIVYTCDD